MAFNLDLRQDAQGRWDESLSPTQVLTGSVNNILENKEQSQKTTYCGNQTDQYRRQRRRRRRRRRRQQQLRLHTNIHDLNEAHSNIQTGQYELSRNYDVTDEHREFDEEREMICDIPVQKNYSRIIGQNKRKRYGNHKNHLTVTRSFSELSMSQGTTKKNKSSIRNNQLSNTTDTNDPITHQHQEIMNYSIENDRKRWKPRYLRVSNRTFKRMLSRVIDANDHIVENLNSNEKIAFVRQITALTNDLYYIGLEGDLWQHYYDLGMREGLWFQRVSKSFAKQHRMCRVHGFSQHTVEQRRLRIAQQSQEISSRLRQHVTQLEKVVPQWQPPIDPIKLSSGVNDLVQHAQQRLRQTFDYKKKMFTINSHDHSLLQTFYDLKPSAEQIHLAKTFWQTTADLLKMKTREEILRRRISLRRLPRYLDHCFDQLASRQWQIQHSSALFDKDERARFMSKYSKLITQFKFESVTLQLDTIRAALCHGQKILDDMQLKLSETNEHRLQVQTIRERELLIRNRHELYLKYKLNTFFDEAPMTSKIE